MTGSQITKLVTLALAVLWCWGCGTTQLVVTREGKNPGPSSSPMGVPFNLTRPNFVVVETLATATNPETTYTLTLDYEPDPNQRYTVNVDPAMFTESDFILTQGANGELATINAKSRDQIVPTISAVGEFLIKAASVVATQGATLPVALAPTPQSGTEASNAMLAGDAEAQVIKLLTIALKPETRVSTSLLMRSALNIGLELKKNKAMIPTSETAKCFNGPSQEPEDPVGRALWRIDQKQQIWDGGKFIDISLKAQCAALKLFRERAAEFFTAEAFAKNYHDLVKAERQWLETGRELARVEGLPEATPANAGSRPCEKSDVSMQNCADYVTKRTSFESSASQQGKKLLAKLEAALLVVDSKAYAEARAPIIALGDSAKTLVAAADKLMRAEVDEKMLASVLTMEPLEWRRRHIVFIEKQQALLNRQRLQLGVDLFSQGQPNPRKEIDHELARLDREWHSTIGAENEFVLVGNLRRLLGQIAQREEDNPAPPSPNVPGLTDYETARKELDGVLTAIATKRATLKRTEPTPPPSRRSEPPLLVHRGPGNSTPEWVRDCIDNTSTCTDGGWTQTIPPTITENGKPEFVIVIDKGEG